MPFAPSLRSNRCLQCRVNPYGHRLVLPSTPQFIGAALTVDDVVDHDITPLGTCLMTGSHNDAAFTGQTEGAVFYEVVASTIVEVHGTLNETVVDILTGTAVADIGIPCVLIRTELAVVESLSVVAAAHGQTHGTCLTLHAIAVDIGDILGIEVGAVYLNNPLLAIGFGIGVVGGVFPTDVVRATVVDPVADDGLLFILTDKMYEGLILRNGHQFLIGAVLDEDEPGGDAPCRSSINSLLHCLIVATAVLCNHGIKYFCYGLRAFHHGECDVTCGEGIAAEVGDGISADAECVLLAVGESVVSIGNALAAKRPGKLFTIQHNAARSGLDTFVEAEHDVAAC